MASTQTKKPVVVAMTRVRETKNKVRYESDDPTAAVDIVYVSKSAFADDKYPAKATLTFVTN